MKFLEAKALKMRRDTIEDKMLGGPSADKDETTSVTTDGSARGGTSTSIIPPSTEPSDSPEPSHENVTLAAAALATELGVDITTVIGSGAGGRITAADVRKAANG